MPFIISIDNQPFKISLDSSSIRDDERYDAVREQINKRHSPLSGGTDWACVKDSCQALARDKGIDLLLSGYFTVAALKTSGLAEFANGLELLLACLNNETEVNEKRARARKEALDWVNSRVLSELKQIKPDQQALRDLYRCERLCDSLFHVLERQQPHHVVDYEGLAYVLFEHIDRIETRLHSAVKQQKRDEEENPTITVKKSRRQNVFACAFGAILVVIIWLAYPYIPYFQTPFITYSPQPSLNSERALKEFTQRYSPSSLTRWQDAFVAMYQQAIESELDQSIETPKVLAAQHLNALTTLYGEHEASSVLLSAYNTQREEALESTNKYIDKFRAVRTKMANIALLAEQNRWWALQKQTRSLENFAISLSPIYGRADYVTLLIEQGEFEKANNELMVLTERLNHLSWKVAELNEALNEASAKVTTENDN
ncbi:type VI secretion system ImpA family N-terminal domain-containing protein [Salinivibrio proteolyticus]|uniref:Type VI secretion system ImpA family N-terminal domain-containing protein n=1 Tax=Salinivibrio proteolyticus TaxID=334715 RepID=A0ABY7LLK6_9GAMM|nr:type VI secretion system ImpA family N-terminal domain-containing protein [Salinivibrio proteolyticus]WBA16795.1 type VI secretion system ImpA family N-terminal domain-containing protein [Salinivibrio proteolyticus]